MKALLVLASIALLMLALVHLAYKPAFIVVHRGQKLPSHYIQAWAFGNVTIVEVAPSHTVVTIGPWP
jgi:uncharacterized phage-associated protein